jgi:hypothetical protein
MEIEMLAKTIHIKRWAVILMVFALPLITILLISPPMLVNSARLAYAFGGGISDPPLIVMNPLRDKEPEKVANAFLKRLQREEPTSLLRPIIEHGAEFEHICQREREYRLKTWPDFTREDNAEGVHLIYWPHRENYIDGFAPMVFITVAKVENELKVISYSAGY